MSGSDDGRGNSEEREGGPPARVLPGGQIVQAGQVDHLPVIERDDGQFHKVEDANEYIGELRLVAKRLNAQATEVRDERRALEAQLAGAVSSWPSARNVIEAVREGQLGLDALREVVTILDIHLGGQSKTLGAVAGMGGPHASEGPVVTRFVAFWKDPYRGWRLALIGPIVAVCLLVEWAYWEFSERIFGWRNH